MPRRDGPFQVVKRINNNPHILGLPGEYNDNATFNFSDLSPFDFDSLDSRTNPSQEGGDDEDIRSSVPTPGSSAPTPGAPTSDVRSSALSPGTPAPSPGTPAPSHGMPAPSQGTPGSARTEPASANSARSLPEVAPRISQDEPFHLPKGPITSARAKKWKEALLQEIYKVEKLKGDFQELATSERWNGASSLMKGHDLSYTLIHLIADCNHLKAFHQPLLSSRDSYHFTKEANGEVIITKGHLPLHQRVPTSSSKDTPITIIFYVKSRPFKKDS